MDGFTGIKTEAAEELPDAVEVMDPFRVIRLYTGHGLQTDKQKNRLEALFVADDHAEVEASWGIYQRVIAAYREPEGTRGKQLMQALIDAVSTGVPAALTEVITLGRTLKRRAGDALPYFDRPGTSNGPTEALTAGSNTSAAPPSASGTLPTTLPGHSSRPADSDAG
jgi:transposase